MNPPPMAQGHHLGGQQIPPLQKLPGLPQNFPVQLQNNQQGQPLQGPAQQIGQLQVPQSMGPGSFGQNMLSGQLPVSQPLMQQNASVGAVQAPSAVSNSMQAIPGQQHLPSNVAPQMLQQPVQQMPSQAPQLLLQQQAALQSSYQSSQQAIYQLQQQLQLMQQQQQSNLNHQQPTQVAEQHVFSMHTPMCTRFVFSCIMWFTADIFFNRFCFHYRVSQCNLVTLVPQMPLFHQTLIQFPSRLLHLQFL